jgi:hypothetical protein
VDIPTQYNNVAPRVGFAYSARPSTVVRGGYGLSYFPGNYTSNGDLKNAPFTSVYAPACQSTEALFGPDFRHVDLSLFKNFPVTERVNLQFRVESFNISNTPNFFIANNNSGNQQFGNAAFGTISATDPNYVPRQYQFVLKAQF